MKRAIAIVALALVACSTTSHEPVTTEQRCLQALMILVGCALGHWLGGRR